MTEDLRLHWRAANTQRPTQRPKPDDPFELSRSRPMPTPEPSLRVSVPSAPASIVEMARALRYNVDLIYEYVYTNVQTYFMWGLHKGALGTLIDRVGGCFEQAALMVALLRESGYTVEFARGTIRLTRTQIEQWLGTTETETSHPSEELLFLGQIPANAVYDEETGILLYIDMGHVWVRVNIDGTLYVFDPTYKIYEYTSGIDLSEVITFDETALMDGALDGATTSSSFVQNLNRENSDPSHPGIVNFFQGYGTELLDWIKTNMFDASVEDIIGGKQIQPQEYPIRQTSLPYQAPGSTTLWWGDIPDSLRATLRIECGGIDHTLFTDEAYAKRLSIIFNSSGAPLLLKDGDVQAPGSTQTPDVFIPATFTVTHPFVDPFADQTWTQGIFSDPDGVHVIGQGYGPSAQAMVDYHRRKLRENSFDSGDPGAENVIGESLEVYYFMYKVQFEAIQRILEQLSVSTMVSYHDVGTAAYTSKSQGPQFDLGGSAILPATRADDLDGARNACMAMTLYAGGLEGGILQQNVGVKGLNSVSILDNANSQGQKIFTGNTLTWTTIDDQLTNWSDEMSNFQSIALSETGSLIVQEDGATTIGEWVGGAWLSVFGVFVTTQLRGQIPILGGATSEPVSKENTNKGALDSPEETTTGDEGKDSAPCSCDPVSLFSGNFFYNRTDMVLGSGGFPYSLEFSRSYDSAQRMVDGPLGLGWTHNFAQTMTIGSAGLRATGEVSPDEGAATIAHAYALLQMKLYETESDPIGNHAKLISAVIATQWLMDFMTGNGVTFGDGKQARTFVNQVDGTYKPAPGYAETLVKNMDGTFTLTSPQQEVWNFNAGGFLTSHVDPMGVTLSYGYDGSNRVTTVSNGLGRTLTLTYSGARLESVSDGNGREVTFTIDDGQLTEFTDAEGNTITYAYGEPGQLTQIFLPANPAIPIITNEFDSLGRIKTQTPANEGTTNYYFAGYRSEIVDPSGDGRVTFYNALGSLTKEVNALGQEIIFERDGMNRLVSTTYPEGNKVLLEYDENNNVTTKTWVPKPGSSLSNVVHLFTFDSVWNKLESFTDGEGNVTSYEYHPTTGDLTKVTRPAVGGDSPVTDYTYNGRGQVETITETITDTTSMVTKFDYDVTTEVMTSVTRDFSGEDLVTAFGYNAWGDVDSVTDPNLNETTFEFDNERRMTLRTECTPFEFETIFEYDENGNQTAMKRQTGEVSEPFQVWSSAYRANNTLLTTTDPAGNVTTLAYNSDNHLISKTDAEGRQWQYEYDELSRIHRVIDPSGNASDTRTYTDNGLLASIADARGNTTQLEYDGLDRLDKRIYPDETFEQYTYNTNSQVLTLLTRKGDTIENEYDALSRLETRQPGSLPLQTMTYNLAGWVLNVNTPTDPGDPSSGDYSFEYDTAGRLFLQRMPNNDEVTYELDDNGNRTKLTWPDSFFAEYPF